MSLLHKQPVLLITGRRAQTIMPPLRATATPNPALDILVNSQRMSLLDHADQELAGTCLPRCSFRGCLWDSRLTYRSSTRADLCSTKATPEEQAKCWEVRCSASTSRWKPACCRVSSAFLRDQSCVCDTAMSLAARMHINNSYSVLIMWLLHRQGLCVVAVPTFTYQCSTCTHAVNPHRCPCLLHCHRSGSSTMTAASRRSRAASLSWSQAVLQLPARAWTAWRSLCMKWPLQEMQSSSTTHSR